MATNNTASKEATYQEFCLPSKNDSNSFLVKIHDNLIKSVTIDIFDIHEYTLRRQLQIAQAQLLSKTALNPEEALAIEKAYKAGKLILRFRETNNFKKLLYNLHEQIDSELFSLDDIYVGGVEELLRYVKFLAPLKQEIEFMEYEINNAAHSY